MSGLAPKKEIHEFALKWLDKFRDRSINQTELFDCLLGEECAALGFSLEYAPEFSGRYGEMANNHEEVKQTISEFRSLHFLTSAIYALWKYFNYWAFKDEETFQPQNREWFILAFEHLASLTESNPYTFEGTLRKIRITTYGAVCLGPHLIGKEIEQRLTITRQGRVWFSAYNHTDTSKEDKTARTKNFKINKALAENLLKIFEEYFAYTSHIGPPGCDAGYWNLELTNRDGKTYNYSHPIDNYFDHNGTDLSQLIRESLDIPNLWVFDCNSYDNGEITKFTLDYRRLAKIHPDEIAKDPLSRYLSWDYSEQLILDREAGTIEYFQNVGPGCKISHKFEMKEAVKSLMDDFGIFANEGFFTDIEGNPDDAIDASDETKDYKLTIDYKNAPQLLIEGSYDKNGLPKHFEKIATKLSDFMLYYGIGDILNPDIYGKPKRRKSDYILCSVTFSKGYKTYYYLTDDDSIKIGDLVYVPVGSDGHEAVVKVVKIDYFNEEELPLPLERTKKILRKVKTTSETGSKV
ncbi:MAG: hypothetical protein GX221_02820 [Candidatus Riflebacteria bacterium]|nr:hypothetical protein [Candidatus Riflebacteria bacterium]